MRRKNSWPIVQFRATAEFPSLSGSTVPSSFAELQDVDIAGPFVRSATQVFSAILNCECRPGPVHPVKNGHQMHAVTSVIGLSGGLSGAISITLSRAGAMEILNRMTGIEATEVDDFVRDAVGEIANMIGGAGKKELSDFNLLLGLPQVIVGEDYRVYSPRWARHCWVALESELGPCAIDVGFDATRVG